MFSVLSPQADRRTSSFLITINVQDEDTELNNKRFKEVLQTVYSNFDRYLQAFVRKVDSAGNNQDVPINIDVQKAISEPVIESAIEVGPKKHRLHSHALVRFKHETDLYFKVKLSLFRDDLQDAYGFTPYVRVKYIHDKDTNLRNYINKDQ